MEYSPAFEMMSSPMPFIYHLVPENLTGRVLYPLNELKTRLPEVYATHLSKYSGRESLMQRQIPPLHCLWNDVLHCSPVHPAQLRQSLITAGFDWHSRLWFTIHPANANFSEENTAIFFRTLRDTPKQLSDFKASFTKFVPFSEQELLKITELPIATASYFRFAKAADEAPLLFNCVPHILYRGSIHVSGVDVLRC